VERLKQIDILQIMYTFAQDDPTYAEAITNDSSVSEKVRYLACKALMQYYSLNDDAESVMHYYKKGRIYSNKKGELFEGEDLL
jgi:hypothetical protein